MVYIKGCDFIFIKVISLMILMTFISYNASAIQQENGDVPTDSINKQSDTASYDSIYIGYGYQYLKGITSAVSVVNSCDLTHIPVRNLAIQLQSRLSGVNVITSGAPGAASLVRIRGINDLFNGGPLYVVDGVPINDIQYVNPNDVESVTVLKDAGTTALYGLRSSEGVIVVTTRKGNGKLRATYNMFTGNQVPGKGPTNLLNTQGFADLQWLVYKNDGTNEIHPIYGVSTNATPTFPSWSSNTNWYNEITETATFTNHNLSLSGGNEQSRFLINLNYFNQDGIVIYTKNRWISTRFNSSFDIGKITIGENVQLTHRSGTKFGNFNMDNAIGRVYRLQSIIPVKMNQTVSGFMHIFNPGEWGGTGLSYRLGQAHNAVADLTRDADDQDMDMRVFGNIYMQANILKGLYVRSSFGGTYQNGYFSDYTFSTYENSENNMQSSLREGAYYLGDWIWTNTLNYEKLIQDHRISALLGSESLKPVIYRGLSAGRSGYFSDAVSFRTLSNGQNITEANSGFYKGKNIYSAFANLNYAYREKIMLNASLRDDSNSGLLKKDDLGTYYSVGAGWRISNYLVTDDRLISDITFRANHGTTGDFILSSSPARDSAILVNQTNIGVDVGVLRNSFKLRMDYFKKSGFLINKGLDVELLINQNIAPELKLSASLFYSTYTGKIKDMDKGFVYPAGSSVIGNIVRNEKGHSLSGFYGFQVEGLFQSDLEVSMSPKQLGAAPGFFRYKDVDNNGMIDANDKVYIGNPNPKFTFGFNFGLQYKRLDFTALLYGSQGNDIFNYTRWWTDFWSSFQGQKSKDLLYNSWTSSRTNASVPKATNISNFSTNGVVSSYYVEDGSYIRLKNLQIGYSFPPLANANKLRIYLQGINLLTFTKYSGLDPELGGTNLAFGIDYGNYPQTAQYVLGVDLEF